MTRFIRERGRSRPRSHSVAIIGTLALGIAGTTAIFSLLMHAYLPAGWSPREEIVSIMKENRSLGFKVSPTADTLAAWKRSLSCCKPLVGMMLNEGPVRTSNGAKQVRIANVDTGFFELLGVRPIVGRIPEEHELRNRTDLAVIGRRLADELFGEAEAAIGRKLTVEGKLATVVGVVREDVLRPLDLDDRVDVIRPIVMAQHQNVSVFARLRGDTTESQAQAEIDTWASSNRTESEEPGVIRWTVLSHLERIDSNTARLLRVALIAGLILVIVTLSNLAHLLAARAEDQKKALATRWALGAGRVALLKWRLKEAFTRTLVAGVMAAGLAWAGLKVLTTVAPPELRSLTGATVDGAALLFAIFASFLALVLASSIPIAWRSAGRLMHDLRTDPRLGDGSSRLRRVAGELHVLTIIGSACGLAVTAFLMLATVTQLGQTSMGFDAEGLDVFTVTLSEQKYGQAAARGVFFDRFIERLASQSSVDALAMASQPPPGSGLYIGSVRFGTEAQGATTPGVGMTSVGPGYFRTVRQEVIAGRSITEDDIRSTSPVVVLSETAARHFGPTPDSAVGETVWLGDERKQVVGVVADLHVPAFLKPFGNVQLYRPLTRYPTSLTVLARSSGALDRAAKSIAKRLDPDATVERASMESVFARAIASVRFISLLLSLLLLLAIGLATAGVYAVFARFVARNQAQIALRMALGATQRSIRSWLLKRVMIGTVLGLVIGVLVSYPAGRLLGDLLFGVDPDGLLARVAAVWLVLMAVFFATAGPMARTRRVEPAEILKSQ